MDPNINPTHLDPITYSLLPPPPEVHEQPRAPIPKLDEDRLLKPDAFPFLYSSMKKLKFQNTKGKEAENLDKLVSFYKSWAHRVFPKYPFEKFVSRTERLCRGKRLKIHLEEWLHSETHSELESSFLNAPEVEVVDSVTPPTVNIEPIDTEEMTSRTSRDPIKQRAIERLELLRKARLKRHRVDSEDENEEGEG